MGLRNAEAHIANCRGLGAALALATVVLFAASCSDDSSDSPEGESGAGASAAPGGAGSGDGGGGTGSNGGGRSGSGSGGGSANAGADAPSGGAGSGGETGGSDSGGGSGGSAPSTGGQGGGGSGSGGSDPGPVVIPGELLNPDYTTTWNPGILRDDQLDVPLGEDGLPVRTTVCASPKPGDNLNSAISNCPEGQVVKLDAGTYQVTSAVRINKGVVLRGAGSGAGGTTIERNGGGAVIEIGEEQDQACYDSAYDNVTSLTQDALKETTTIHVGGGASKFKAGDLALLDEVDDASVQQGDCEYFKRVSKRSTSERVEIAAVDTGAGTLTLSSPLHWTFRAGGPYNGQIARVAGDVVRWAGVESLALKGGNNPGYNGQVAGGIDVSNAAYSWIKDVQTDGSIGGMHVSLTGTYRVVVRDGYFHHSADYGFGHDCYGIVMRCGAADSLIENNVVRYMNKPIMFNASGGGNVIAYNYADNSWADPPSWQEINVDTHCAFPHMELMEGNYAPHMGATITHGNAGYLTYFRNYSSSQFASPPVAGSNQKQDGQVAALTFPEGDLNMTVVGNVMGSSAAMDLGTANVSKTYICYGSDGACIIWVESKSDVSYTSLWLHGNYDTVNDEVMWNPDIDTKTLPASLYRKSKPAWWPEGTAWPWVGPDLDPMVGSLPAYSRAQSL